MPDQPATPYPSDRDINNEQRRRLIAERQNAEYAEAMGLALGALGPGWKPWMKLVLIDSAHRQSGNTAPVATVYKVYRGEDRLTEHSMFLRRMPDGQVRKADSYEILFGDLLHENHPARTVEVRGQKVPVGRYELCWSTMELYHPHSAKQLASLRASRERGKQEREQKRFEQDNPLLAWAERQAREEEGPGGPTPGR